ncbi:MAG: response regulator transcription factor [Chitinophagaceae bacterium]
MGYPGSHKLITLVVVEDDSTFRKSVVEMIAQEKDLACEASFENAASFLRALPSVAPDIFWLDISLPDGSGIDLVRKIREEQPQSLCLMCTLHDDDKYIFDALRAGADGYILKNSSSAKMVESIYELVNGGSPMSAFIARKVLGSFRNDRATELDELTDREQEVLRLIAKGLLYKEVAAALGITTETVKKHLKNIYSKLHVQNRTEAVIKYLSSGKS